MAIRKNIILLLAIFTCFTSCAQEVILPLFPCTERLEHSYGVNCHLAFSQDYTRRDAELKIMNEIGINMVRGGSHFFTLGYKNGQFNPKMMDSIAASVENAKIPMHGDLSLDAFGKKMWEDVDAYSRYVNYITERYNGRINYWEVANEVDLSMKTENAAYKYAQVLKQIYPYFRNNGKQNKILLSGLANVQSQFFDELCSYEADSYFDVMNMHSYDAPEKLPLHFKSLRTTMDKYGWEKEVWLGECGMHTAPDTTKTNKWSDKEWLIQEQARRLPRIYLISFAYGINKVYWYEIRAEEKDPYDREHHFGLLHSDLTPKPAALAYKTLIKMCPDGSTRPQLIQKGENYIVSWLTPKGKKMWAVWSVGKLPAKIIVKGRTKYYDLFGKKKKKLESLSTELQYIENAKDVTFML
jgi:hypothetical protein